MQISSIKMGVSISKHNCRKKNNNQRQKKEENVTVILKISMHCYCQGCTENVFNCIQSFEVVKSVQISEDDSIKFSVASYVDPEKLRRKVEKKMKKKVELISPKPNKDENNDNGKLKEPVTITLKVNLDCNKCTQKIVKIVSSTKGFQELSIDQTNHLVTVRGTMDIKALVESLERKLRQDVEVVPPKNEGGSGGDGGCDSTNTHPYGPYFNCTINEICGRGCCLSGWLGMEDV